MGIHTEHGKQMAKFPLDPIFAHLLLQSQKYECTKEILTVVAMLSSENVFYRPGGTKEVISDTVTESKAVDKHRRFRSHEGDLPTLVSFKWNYPSSNL